MKGFNFSDIRNTIYSKKFLYSPTANKVGFFSYSKEARKMHFLCGTINNYPI